MVEFVFVAPLLIMLVFAIIVFGLALNIKQDLTRVASEGARAGAVALPGEAETAAMTACTEALERFFGGADTSCSVTLRDAAGNTIASQNSPLLHSVEVAVVYNGDLAGNAIPFVGQVIPDTLSSNSVARTNQP